MPLRPKMDFREFGGIFLRRKWAIVLTAFSILFAAGAYCLVTPEMYKSSIGILILPQAVPHEYVRSTVNLRAEQQLATIRQQVMSRKTLSKVMEEIGIFKERRKKMTSEELFDAMRKRIGIEVTRNHGGNETFSISFEYETPRLAMRTAERLAAVFVEENLKTRERQAVGTSEFLDSQLKETQERLEGMEKEVEEYKMRHMGELPQQMDANLRMLAGLQDRLRTNENAIRTAEERQSFIDAQIASLGKSLPAAAADPWRKSSAGRTATTASLEADLARKRERLAALGEKYTDKVPEVASTRAEVEELERRLAHARLSASTAAAGKGAEVPAEPEPAFSGTLEELRQVRIRQKTVAAELSSLAKERAEIRKSIGALEGKLGRSPRREQEMTSMIRDYENLKKSYDDLLRKKLEADVSQNLEKRQKGMQFQIIDPANLPEEPFRPNRRKVMGGALLGSLFLGFALAILLEAADPRLRDVADFRQLYNVPILGYIPELKGDETGTELKRMAAGLRERLARVQWRSIFSFRGAGPCSPG